MQGYAEAAAVEDCERREAEVAMVAREVEEEVERMMEERGRLEVEAGGGLGQGGVGVQGVGEREDRVQTEKGRWRRTK